MPGSSRAAWCALLALAAAGCGGGGAGGGSTPTLGRCTTGTELVLFYPVPNTRVPAKTTKSIYVASNYPIITVRSLAARPAGSSSGLGAYRLSGPVAAPTPTPTPTPIPTPPSATPTPSAKPSQAPTPFPSPPFTGAVYYVARGFHLKPHQTYAVEVTSATASCLAAPIPGARFFTLRF
jgi:hypothetical protein